MNKIKKIGVSEMGHCANVHPQPPIQWEKTPFIIIFIANLLGFLVDAFMFAISFAALDMRNSPSNPEALLQLKSS